MVSPLDKVFFLRVTMGILAGLTSGFLGFVNPSPYTYLGIFIAITFYLLSVLLAKLFFFKLLDKKNKRRIYTNGLGSFVMLFLFTWILYNTWINLETISQ
ncbi:hypothetical protein HRbin06_00112 [archaeon HR06]|nr:hypothetical protein HRbin06_00112 [archaeon HR06]